MVVVASRFSSMAGRPFVRVETKHCFRLRRSDLVSRFRRDVVPAMKRDHVTVESVFITEPAENTFTGLPVRTGNVCQPS